MTNSFYEPDFSKMADVTKMMSGYKMPNFDMGGLMVSQRKNLETMTSVNKTFFEDMGALIQHQAELMRHGFGDANGWMSSIGSTGTPQEKMARHIEASQSLVEKFMANIHETTDAITKSSTHAIESISNRLRDSLGEISQPTKMSTTE